MLEAFGLTDPGCVRSNNEDFFLLIPPINLYLLADGMGGAQAGEQASKLAVETVAECILRADETSGKVLLSAVEEANRRVFEASNSDPSLHGMGTTLTACWLVGGELLFASVGDSRAYLVTDGELHRITEDQTWSNEVGRKLGISDEALKFHPMRHVLTMAVGVSERLRVQSYVVPVDAAALVLLCSDGLHGVLEPEKIAAVLQDDGSPQSRSLQSKCERLIQEVRSAGAPDNVTAVLVRPMESV